MGMIMHDDVPYGEGTSYTQGTGIAINNNVIAVDADNAPTENSEKPVKSKGVHSAVEQIYADNGVLGAKNLFNVNDVYTTSENTNVTIDGSDIRIQNTVTGTYRFRSFWLKNLPKNTDVIVTMNVAITSGNARVLLIDREGSTPTIIWTQDILDGVFSKKFNTGTWGQLVLTLYCATEESVIGDVTYSDVMIRLASDPDDTYVPYAMTNRELTEELTVKSLTINLTASDKATKMRDDSRRCGNVVNIRIQLQVTAVIANNTEIFRLDGLPHSGYGIAILGDTNEGTIIPLVVHTSNNIFSMSCKKAIPTGYYAISYTYII